MQIDLNEFFLQIYFTHTVCLFHLNWPNFLENRCQPWKNLFFIFHVESRLDRDFGNALANPHVLLPLELLLCNNWIYHLKDGSPPVLPIVDIYRLCPVHISRLLAITHRHVFQPPLLVETTRADIPRDQLGWYHFSPRCKHEHRAIHYLISSSISRYVPRRQHRRKYSAWNRKERAVAAHEAEKSRRKRASFITTTSYFIFPAK